MGSHPNKSWRSALALFACVAAADHCRAMAADATTVVRALEDATWRLQPSVERALPPVDWIQEDALEVEDWREYAYEGGALRLYVSRGERRVMAFLSDVSGPRHHDFDRLSPTDHYAVYLDDSSIVIIPTQPIDRKLFDRLKAGSWTAQQLDRHLGAPSFRWHAHGIGQSFLEYVPQGLSFVGEHGAHVTPDRYYLWDQSAPCLGPCDDLPRATARSHERYRGDLQRQSTEFAERLRRERHTIAEALTHGVPSPDGRFVVAAVNVGGTWNTQQTLVRERGKPERRYHAEYLIESDDYRWLDDRSVIYQIWQPTGDVEFYVLDAVTGRKRRVAIAPNDGPRVTAFGTTPSQALWYTTDDGVRHEIPVK